MLCRRALVLPLVFSAAIVPATLVLGCGESEPPMSNTQRFAVEHEAELRTFRERLAAVTTAAAAAPALTSDALVFRLADQAQLGGVRFAATNEGLDRTISLRVNLSVQAHRAIGAALTGVLPGVVLDSSQR